MPCWDLSTSTARCLPFSSWCGILAEWWRNASPHRVLSTLVASTSEGIAGKPIFAPPKGGKIREVPLPEWVAVPLAEHIRRHPPIEVTLPWLDLDGPARTSRLIFTSRESGSINRNYFNPHIWKSSLEAVKIATTRGHGMHALRHHYASVLQTRGVASLSGHWPSTSVTPDPGFTLRIYSHLMPNTEDRAGAVDAAHAPSKDSKRETGGEG